jgi:putative PEP-CTERM system TPR-repeat lipoprotein
MGMAIVADGGRKGMLAVLRLAGAAAVMSLLMSCGKDNPDALIASAKDYAAKGDYNAATIQLKNALQQAPNNAVARRLLGEALLEVGDPASAEKELRRALDLKEPEFAVAPALARSMLEMHEYGPLLKEFGRRTFDDAAIESRVRSYVGEAYLADGETQAAAESFDAALKVVPEYPPARLGQVRLALRQGRYEDAARLADGVIKSSPKSAEAYALKADAVLGTGDRAGARTLLQGALQADPAFLPAHLSLASLALEEGAFDAAAAQLDLARKVARGDLRVTYLAGLLAYRTGDLNKARDFTLQILKRAPDHVPTLVLAGAIELDAKQLASAEDSLRKALARAPSHPAARRLLVATLLRSGQPARALEALQPLVEGGVEPSPPLLMLAGETYLANGDLPKAAAFFDRASKVDEQSIAARTRLGQIALMRGHAEEGIRELEDAANASTKESQADIALVLGHLRAKDGAKALAAARAFVKKQPGNPVAYQLQGGVQMLLKETAAARASFEQALKVAPNFLPAAFNLANLDLADKKPDAARRRLAAMHETAPKDEQIILAQAAVAFRSGAPAKDVEALLQQAIATNPGSSNARIALIDHRLRGKDTRGAIDAATDAAAALPKDARVLEALALAQEAAGENEHAVETLERLAQMRPGIAEPLLRLAGLQVRTRAFDAAVDTLRKAQKIAPENRQIDRDLVAIMLSQRKPDEALRLARELQKKAPDFAGGYVLEGDISMLQAKPADAQKMFREALKREPASGAAARKLAAALFADSKTAEGESFSARWLADHPKDTGVRILLADRAMRARDLKRAAAQYQALLSVDPNNVVALNNLAWIGGETGDAKAVAYAERAVRLAPQSASVLDTLGTLLVKRGEPERGLEYLAQARDVAPARLDIRLSYARALMGAGRKDAARKELRAIVEAKDDTAEKRAAAELLQKL